MGKLYYDNSLNSDIEDRVLAHLQIVIGAKLRRKESFFFSWKDDSSIGDGRTTIWIDPHLPIVFKYYGGRMPMINRTWIEALVESSNSPGGLQIVPEPTAPAPPKDADHALPASRA